MYASNDRQSFEEIRKFYDLICQIKERDDPPVVLVETKVDLPNGKLLDLATKLTSIPKLYIYYRAPSYDRRRRTARKRIKGSIFFYIRERKRQHRRMHSTFSNHCLSRPQHSVRNWQERKKVASYSAVQT